MASIQTDIEWFDVKKKINVLIFKTSPINLLMILLINYGSFLFQKTVMI